jgi:acyl transferase domain-containing protein
MSAHEEVLSAARVTLAIKRSQGQTSDAGLPPEPIAIVGIGCRLPGNIHSPEDCWRVFADGIDTITEVPSDRWSADEFFDPDPTMLGKTNGRWGGWLSDVRGFDPVLFGISPREAAEMDPQQRLLLEVAWEAIQDSGRAPESLAGSRTGVFAGICLSDFERLAMGNGLAINANTCTGAYRSVASGRISFLLDLRGPSLSIDTACSSSLVAIHTACQSLRCGESDLALAGGVNLHLLPEHYIGLARLAMLSPDGRCKTFDAAANGFVPSEGCGLVVLKRLSDALADGERIYAVIRGSAINQDGRTNSLTAPSGLSQQDVVRGALRNAQVPPSSISYVETHGTGTALGDPLEVEALAAVLGTPGQGVSPCFLGAAKSNLGHLEAAAGVTGLIKAALSLHHDAIPANLHFSELNPHISLEGTRFRIPVQLQPWPRGQSPRFAGASSFGFSGTNAHVVLEEAPRVPARWSKPGWEAASVLAISARQKDALRDTARQYRDYLMGAEREVTLQDLCHAAAIRGSHHEERLAVTAATREEMRSMLDRFLEGHKPAGVFSGRSSDAAEPLVFVCSGQGSQWPGMGTVLFRQSTVFRGAMEACDAAIRRWAGWSLIEHLSFSESESRLAETEYAQPAIFAVEVALARLLESWGVTPAMVVGHSAGEVAAAHIAGILPLEEAARIVVLRGKLMQPAGGRGRMAAVRLPAADVARELTRYGGAISIAAVNSPQSTVISGDSASIEALTAEFRERGTGCMMMPVNYAFHSSQMQPYSEELARTIGPVDVRKGRMPLLSTVFGRAVDATELDAAYWARNVRETVMFQKAVETAVQMGSRVFVEVGPHPVLLAAVGECLGPESNSGRLITTLRRNQDDIVGVLSCAGALYVGGHPISWEAVYGKHAPAVSLPNYPYQRQRFQLERPMSAQRKMLAPLLGRKVLSPALQGAVFETELDLRSVPYLVDHQIAGRTLAPMTAFLEMAQQAIWQVHGERRALADATFTTPLVLSEDKPCTVQIVIEDGEFRIFSLRDEAWTLHARGGIVGGTGAHTGSAHLPLGDRCSPESLYERLARAGVAFGPAFRTVRTMHIAPGEAWIEASLQNTERRIANEYQFHPSLLDGCLQASVAAWPGDLNRPFLPFSLERYELFRNAGEAVNAHAVLRSSVRPDELSADIEVLNSSGEAISRVTGLRMKRPTDARVYSIDWRPAAPATSPHTRKGKWLVIHGGAAGEALVPQLWDRGQSARVLQPGEPLPALDGWDGMICLGQLDAAELLRVIQEVCRYCRKDFQFWLITQGAVALTPAEKCDGLWQAPLWGMMRTIAIEHPELVSARVDLDSTAPDYVTLAEQIADWDGEEEMAFRSGVRYVRRLSRVSEGSLDPVHWTVPERGSVEKLALAPMERRRPQADELEVEVEASALNFRDVLNVLGKYPGDIRNAGVEFCGRIIRIGSSVVNYQPGDRVMGVAFGAMASFVTVPAAFVIAVPEGWGPVESAALPNAYLTAWHSLVHLGKIKRGERVLIHAATGGVGLAAIEIARWAGAEVFATAGSEEKRAYLRSLGITHVFHSRTSDFAKEIVKITGAKGVDLVLNSLSGELIGASFEVLAEGGRFLEIGKNDLWTPEQASALGKRVQYFIVDLGVVMETDATLVQAELAAIRDLLASRTLRPLPTRIFDFSDARSAFLLMAQARHIGKIVLRHATSLHISPAATYLIVGGLGAIGLEIARWLAARGACHLLLVGRRSPGMQVQDQIETLRRCGRQVEVRAADACCREQIDELLRDAERTMPRLAGVIYAAGVVDDGVLLQQNEDRIKRVMAPKITGAWNLHELTAGMPLDFFMLCSSVASVLGSPSQLGYAAGNAFLDALAHYRRARGLPALAINWGAWADAGMAAQVEVQGRKRVLPGIRPMQAVDCLESLQKIAGIRRPQVIIAEADWTQFEPTPRLLEDLTRRRPDVVPSAPGEDLQRKLEKAPIGNRHRILIDYLRELAVRILGIDPSHTVDERQPLIKMGLDSLMAIEFRNYLAMALNRPLSATLLFDYPSILSLADFLLGTAAPAPEDEPDQVMELLTGISEQDAEELLRQEMEHN